MKRLTKSAPSIHLMKATFVVFLLIFVPSCGSQTPPQKRLGNDKAPAAEDQKKKDADAVAAAAAAAEKEAMEAKAKAATEATNTAATDKLAAEKLATDLIAANKSACLTEGGEWKNDQCVTKGATTIIPIGTPATGCTPLQSLSGTNFVSCLVSESKNLKAYLEAKGTKEAADAAGVVEKSTLPYLEILIKSDPATADAVGHALVCSRTSLVRASLTRVWLSICNLQALQAGNCSQSDMALISDMKVAYLDRMVSESEALYAKAGCDVR